jgi:hypothetical protein
VGGLSHVAIADWRHGMRLIDSWAGNHHSSRCHPGGGCSWRVGSSASAARAGVRRGRGVWGVCGRGSCGGLWRAPGTWRARRGSRETMFSGQHGDRSRFLRVGHATTA